MIGFVIGMAVTWCSAHAGGWLVKRWQLGPLGAIAIGWVMGAAFALAVVASSIMTRSAP
jgi:hypothetical protein